MATPSFREPTRDPGVDGVRSDPPVWRSVAGTAFAPGCQDRHDRRGGVVDETARRLSHSEFGVAKTLAGEGHAVRSLPEWPGRGPVADLLVCGRPVEVKSWLPADARAAPPGPRSVLNKLLSARRQAASVVLFAAATGLSEAAARAGVAEFVARGRSGRAQAIRVLGDGFDLAWTRSRHVDRTRAATPDAAVATPARRPPPSGRGRTDTQSLTSGPDSLGR